MKSLLGLVFVLELIVSLAPAYCSRSAQVMLTLTASTQSAAVSVAPRFSTANIGDNVTVAIRVSNVTGLYTWQGVLKFNGTVLNCTGVWVPEDNIFAHHLANYGAPTFGTDVKDGLTYVLFGYTLLGNDHIDLTNGTLFKANFTVKAVGMSPITIATKEKPAWFGPDHWQTWQSYLLDSSMNQMPYVENNGAVAAGRTFAFLTITATNGGTTDPAPDVYAYLDNTNVSVTAIPEAADGGYELGHWELDNIDVGSENPHTVVMDANHTLRAVFITHEPATWTVDDNGPADFQTIQEAINSLKVIDGDTILVKPGTYYGEVSMTKKLTLVGEDRDTTIIDGNRTQIVVQLNGNISGFTLRNGGYAIRISPVEDTDFTGCRIEGNRIIDNYYGAIFLEACANNTIANNVIQNNTLFGIHLCSAYNNTVTHNTISRNGHGFALYGSSSGNTLKNNTMNSNDYNFGVVLRGDTLGWLLHGIRIQIRIEPIVNLSRVGLQRNTSEQLWYSPEPLINDVDASNTADGKPIYYWMNQTDVQVPSDAGYILLQDCTNITIKGCNVSDNLQGILLLNTNNTVIANNNVTGNVYGIYTLRSSNSTLTGNVLEDNLNGVCLSYLSRSTTMRDNSISGSQLNFGVDIDTRYLTDGSGLANDIDASNVVDGKPIIYWTGQHNRQVPKNAGYVMLINSTNVLVEGLNLSSNVQSIFVLASNNTVIADNSITNSVYGIDVEDVSYFPDLYSPPTFDICFNTTIRGNTLVNNDVAIRLDSDKSTVSDNELYRNPLGICLTKTSNSTVSRNTVTASEFMIINPTFDLDIFRYPEWERARELVVGETGGIFVGGYHNLIYGNTVKDSPIGIAMNDYARLYYGSGNVIFHNNFINNTYLPAVESIIGSNTWDNGYPSGGNCWSNYGGADLYSGPSQDEPGSDGIGDVPFRIPAPVGRRLPDDNYPLMAPINTSDLPTSKGNTSLDLITNSSVSRIQLIEAEKIISFNATGAEGTSGFCKIAVPNSIVEDLWHGNYAVLINGQPIPFKNWTDNSSTYIYFTYQHSEHQVTIVPEFQTLAIAMLALVLTSVAVIGQKHRQTKKHCV